jgi:hypothetical protein
LTYKADIAGGSLKVYEARIIADLLLRNLSASEWRQAIELNNVLQKTSVATAKRQASLIKARLKLMTPELWTIIRDGTKPAATQAVFACAIAHSNLLRDFLIHDVRDHFRSGNLALTRSHWRSFVFACQERDPGMTVWSESTADKLGDSVLRILAEVGMLSDGERPLLQPVHYQSDVMDYLKRNKFDKVIRAMQVFI